VLIKPNVIITDSDFHGLKIEGSLSGPCEAKSVSIGDDVFIGSNVTILKGVTIGRGSVIGSNSVITKDIPCNVIAAGSPARIIRPL
jgi:maltose O-acetyltransferase